MDFADKETKMYSTCHWLWTCKNITTQNYTEAPKCCPSHSIHHRITEWFARDFKVHLIPNPLQWVGTPSNRPGCSDPHPAQP